MDFDPVKWLVNYKISLRLNRWPVISLEEQQKEEQRKRIERIWPSKRK